MSEEFAPVIYVDLIKDTPLSLDEWKAQHPAFDPCDDDPDYLAAVADAYAEYRDRFQPWHWHAKREGNFEIVAQGERYFNESDAQHNIDILFRDKSNVYLRQHEQGNQPLRMAAK